MRPDVSGFPENLVLVGAGKMGGALLEGWLGLGMPASALTIIEPQPVPKILELSRARGIALNPGAPVTAAVIVLAIKPQMLEAASPSIAPLIGQDSLLISILAGKTMADLSLRLPAAQRIVRAMPNTPAAVGRGITGAAASPAVTPQQREMADALLRAVGRVEWLDDEAQIDAVTAVSGSGPAYVFLLTECMAAAGAALGLPEGLAARLARATVEGAGELMFCTPGTPPDLLRHNVTSPGGTTAAALDVLMASPGLQGLMTEAIAAAWRRARALAG